MGYHLHFSFDRKRGGPFFHRYTSGGTNTCRAFFVWAFGISVAWPTRYKNKE